MPDCEHVFLSAKPTVSPVYIVKIHKSVSMIYIFRAFPTIKRKQFWASGLWSRGYYISTAGTVSAETIRRYIELQKEKKSAFHPTAQRLWVFGGFSKKTRLFEDLLANQKEFL